MPARSPATLVVLALAAAAPAAIGDDNPEKKLSPDARGKVHAWKAKDGLAYEYFVPKDYDAGDGANLTVVLHGSNLDRRWTFWNHRAGDFRPDDVVVSPDGTTPNGSGGFNFLGDDKNVSRLRALLEEVKSVLNVRQTFLYGHSQGSFFAFHFAGAHPEDVDGICADASGAWTWTKSGPFGHHQAIGIMHGTDDPVVPYGQSRGALDHYRANRYPLVHLRTLFGWGHPPEARQASFVLAWCEGMTSPDPKRVQLSMEHLAEGTADFGDYAALHAVAKRLAGTGAGAKLEGVSDSARAAAARIADSVESLAAKHADLIRKGMKGGKEGPSPAAFHMVRFLDDFDGVPSREALAKDMADLLDKHEKEAGKRLRVFWQKAERAPADAFEEGVGVLKAAYLHHAASGLLPRLAEWEKKAKELKIPKAALSAYAKAAPACEKARDAGAKDYLDLNRKDGKIKP